MLINFYASLSLEISFFLGKQFIVSYKYFLLTY